jgi:hypothetical protein
MGFFMYRNIAFWIKFICTEEEQVNIIEPSDLITPMDIGNFASGTDSMDSDAEIENHERQLEQTW